MRGTSIAEVTLQSYVVTAMRSSLGHITSRMSLGSTAGALRFGPWTTVAQACRCISLPGLFVVGHPQSVTSLHAYWSWNFSCRAGIGMKRRQDEC